MFFHVICFWNFLQICTLHKLQTTVQCSYFTLRIDLSVGNIFIPSYLLTCSHILLLLLLPDQFNFVLVVPLSSSWALTSSFDKKKRIQTKCKLIWQRPWYIHQRFMGRVSFKRNLHYHGIFDTTDLVDKSCLHWRKREIAVCKEYFCSRSRRVHSWMKAEIQLFSEVGALQLKVG